MPEKLVTYKSKVVYITAAGDRHEYLSKQTRKCKRRVTVEEDDITGLFLFMQNGGGLREYAKENALAMTTLTKKALEYAAAHYSPPSTDTEESETSDSDSVGSEEST